MKPHLTPIVSALALAVGLSLLTPPHQAAATPAAAVATGRASVLPGSLEPAEKGDSTWPVLAAGGRYVAFTSKATLSPLDWNDSLEDVYVRDLLTDEVEMISVRPDGAGGTGNAYAGAISADGRFVVFSALPDNVVAGDTNNRADVFVRDRQLDVTHLVSISSAGVQSDQNSPYNWNTPAGYVDVSDDGRYVAFTSESTVFGNTTHGDSNVLVRDRQLGTTTMVSVADDEALPNRGSHTLSMSPTGRYVAFGSNAYNLATGDNNQNTSDVYLRDRTAGTTVLVSRTDADGHTFNPSFDPSISDDGNKVAFASRGALTPGDLNTTDDVFVRTTSSGTTTKISVGLAGEADQHASRPAISGNGSTVAWTSLSGEYVAGGGNGKVHVFQRVGTAAITRESVSGTGALGNGDSAHASLSTDGKVLAFESLAGNLVAGDTGRRDVFFRRKPEVGPHGTTAAFSAAMAKHFTGAANPTLATTVEGRIAAGASPEAQVLALAHDPAFAAKRAPLARLYVAYFTRLPDTGGMAHWLKKYQAGGKLDDISARFAASSEFAARYGSTTNSQFVTLVYQNVLDRSPDAGGLAHWVQKLEGGMSRGTVMTNFSESSEGKRAYRPQVDTTLVVLGLLGGIPAPAVTNPMIADMAADSSALGIHRLLTSSTYAAAT